MKVKVCGITRYQDARLALDLGAWALGLNFYPRSPRFLAPERAAELLRMLPRGALAIGVFVDAPLDQVNDLVEELGLRGVQLHGSETPEYAREVKAELVIKALRVGPGFQLGLLREYQWVDVLLDAHVEGVPGGTGRTFDWEVARQAQSLRPILLSGGLTPENVEEAVARVGPGGVDLASGVEARPGEKDPTKLKKLFEALERRRPGSPAPPTSPLR